MLDDGNMTGARSDYKFQIFHYLMVQYESVKKENLINCLHIKYTTVWLYIILLCNI